VIELITFVYASHDRHFPCKFPPANSGQPFQILANSGSDHPFVPAGVPLRTLVYRRQAGDEFAPDCAHGAQPKRSLDEF
jgi:hypothetical protein